MSAREIELLLHGDPFRKTSGMGVVYGDGEDYPTLWALSWCCDSEIQKIVTYGGSPYLRCRLCKTVLFRGEAPNPCYSMSFADEVSGLEVNRWVSAWVMTKADVQNGTQIEVRVSWS